MLAAPERLGLFASSILVALGCAADPEAATSRTQEPLPLLPQPSAGNHAAHFYVVLGGAPAVELAFAHKLDRRAAASAARAQLHAITLEQDVVQRHVESLGGRVVSRLSRLANALTVTAPEQTIAELARIPGVVRVERAPVYERTLASAVPVIGAPRLWTRSTPLLGDGIRIGIVDSGIDYLHADFAGPGTEAVYDANDPTLIEPGSFPTARVVGGYDFAGDAYDASQQSSMTPQPDADPLDCLRGESTQVAGGHGTHVAGIAAGSGVRSDGTPYTGPYELSLDPAAFRVSPGVAPNAQLYALKIFGCGGSTGLLGEALDRAVDPDQDGDFSDRLDVVNASLGTAYGLGSATDAALVRNLTAAGTLFVVAAGNDGDAFFSVGSPAIYPETLAVAATADSQFVTLRVDAPSSIAGAYGAAEGGFTTRLVDSGPVSGSLVFAAPALGCSPLTNSGALIGKVALLDRGGCQFIEKFDNAVAAGAIAAVVVDDQAGDAPFAMGGGDPGLTPIPGVMIARQLGETIKAALTQGVTVTLTSDAFSGLGSELLASFSSRGPSSLDGMLKPEIGAPGFAIDSARVGSGSQARRSQGTSMASPMVAGAAALVRQARPELEPLEVKAALVNSAKPIGDVAGNAYPVSLVGAGRTNVERAVDTLISAADSAEDGRTALSFGALIAVAPTSEKRSVTLTNRSSSLVTLAVEAMQTHVLPGVSLAVEPKSVTLAGGATAELDVTLALDPKALGAPSPDPLTPVRQFDQPRHYLSEAAGLLRFTGPGVEIGLPFHATVRAASDRRVDLANTCRASLAGEVSLPITGESAHPDPVTTAFELGVLDPADSRSGKDPEIGRRDLLAIGAASNLANVAFDEASVSFAVVVSGEWTTPALGQLSLLGVRIDTDFDGSPDFVIELEALSREGPYADVIAAVTYRLPGKQQTSSRRFINLVPADLRDTQPFYNSVLVLPAFLKDLGQSAESARFAYSVVTDGLNFLAPGESTAWVTFDAGKPTLDTARGGKDNRPLFVGADPIVVHVDPNAPSELPKLLVLHHTNVRGKRYEVIDLADARAEPGNLVIAESSPAGVSAGERFDVEISVTNAGPGSVKGATLELSVQGASVESIALESGSCAADPAASCALPELAPNAATTVRLRLVAPGSAGEVRVTADSTGGCETSLDDNGVNVTVSVAGADVGPSSPGASPSAELRPAGGCGCRAASGPSSERAWVLWWLVAALIATRRARSRR